MKRFLLAMGAAALAFALTACEDSASNASADLNQQASERSGSFPKNGDPNFYCEVTSGEGWAQIKVNIPNYMGHVTKRETSPISIVAMGCFSWSSRRKMQAAISKNLRRWKIIS